MSTELNEAEMEDSKALSLVLTLQYHLVVDEPCMGRMCPEYLVYLVYLPYIPAIFVEYIKYLGPHCTMDVHLPDMTSYTSTADDC